MDLEEVPLGVTRPGETSVRLYENAALRRAALLLAATTFALCLLECGARIEYRVATGEAFPVAAYRERLATAGDADLVLRNSRKATDEEPGHIANKALHPYTGYVHDHARARKSTNRFGFPGFDPLLPPAEDEVRIVVTGGSVALQLFKEGSGRLRSALENHPVFAGRKVQLVGLTLGGYKQPQQLMSLSWFLALGAHFDVVINLDGFNEVVLPYTDNVPEGVHPAFPRSWQLYARKSLDGEEIDRLVEVRTIQTERRSVRAWLGTHPFGSSVFALRVLDRIDARYARELSEAEAHFREQLASTELPYQVSGPWSEYPTDRALFRELVALWQNASLQMHRLCEANDIAYFHFLQPNQYVEDSKPFNADERRHAIRSGSFPPKAAVRAAYGPLRAAGAQLRALGVAFVDLTRLFKAEHETVYRDSCCHFNRRGVDAIALRIAQAVTRRSAPSRPD